MRKEIKTGILIFAASQLLNCLVGLPELMMGLLSGSAIFFELAGLMPEENLWKLKAAKWALLHKNGGKNE